MARYEHKQVAGQIGDISTPPADREEFLKWIEAGDHLEFLRRNADADEIVIYAAGKYCFIYALAVPKDLLVPPDKEDLLSWDCNPYSSAASYISGGGREGLWIERNSAPLGAKTLEHGTQLLYGRTFQGWSGEGRNYFELAQELAHVEELHWRPEHRSYCRYDSRGDLDEIVSISGVGSSDLSLVTMRRHSLEAYLAASDMRLVRLFDFTLVDLGSFSGWSGGEAQTIEVSEDLFYRQRIQGTAAFTRGVQILPLSRPKEDIIASKESSWFGGDDNRYADFIAHDWRNKRVVRISTDPAATTNYFEAEHNKLPFELSPAFFKPEVLSKYRTDRDKYTIDERDIHCRNAWMLRGYDVNEAGQIHAYICDLRNLPYEEQLHWQSYNEEPKAPVSRRAIETDFQGRFTSTISPLSKVVSKVRTWNGSGHSWWKERDETLIDAISKPLGASRDEWADSLMDLTKLINEGFAVKAIRQVLRVVGIEFDDQDGSLKLLERLIDGVGDSIEPCRLEGSRTAQLIRTKAKGHSSGAEAEQLGRDAIQQHETFGRHFDHVCELVFEEMCRIESALALDGGSSTR